MSSPTYWPFAPLTQGLIDTTLKLYEELGPDNLEYKAYLRGLDPKEGKGIEALYLMGGTINSEEDGPDGDIQWFIKVAETGDAKSYLSYLRRLDVPEMVNRAVNYLKGEQEPLTPSSSCKPTEPPSTTPPMKTLLNTLNTQAPLQVIALDELTISLLPGGMTLSYDGAPMADGTSCTVSIWPGDSSTMANHYAQVMQKIADHFTTTVLNTASMDEHSRIAATQRKLRENIRETARRYGAGSEEHQRALYDSPLDPNFDEIDEG